MSNVNSRKPKNTLKPVMLSSDNWIYQANALTTSMSGHSTVTKLRFFAIYQSKLNPKDKSTRKVTFPLADYAKIMGIQRINITQIKNTVKQLINIPTFIDMPDGGFQAQPLFDKVTLFQNENSEWCITVDCHDDLVDFLFDLRGEFFKYRLWNMLRLRESNHQKMYLFIKQRQHMKQPLTVQLDEIRTALGIETEKNTEWRDFRRQVLEPCQKALLASTDIKFTFEPVKKGRGGKTVAILLTIEKNEDYIDQLTLDEFMNQQVEPEIDGDIEAESFIYETEPDADAPIAPEAPATAAPAAVKYDIAEALALLGTADTAKPNSTQVESIKHLGQQLARKTYSCELEQGRITLDEAIYRTVYDAVKIVNDALEKAKYGKGKPIDSPVMYLYGVLNNQTK